MITDRDICILKAVARYYVLSRPQIQARCFPTDKTGRVTRRRLQALVGANLLNRHRAEVIYPNSSPAGSVYYPSPKGCQLLSEHTGDDRHLLTPTRCPQPHHVQHWLAVTETHLKLDAAVDGQTAVALGAFINEWDVVNQDETDPQKRFRLYTLLSRKPKLVCAPDAAFLLQTAGHRKVFYLEQDRGTSGARQVAAAKIKGYRELASRAHHKNHFPEATVSTFTVLCVSHCDRRRDALKRAFRGMDGAGLWKFASATELCKDTFFFDPIWHATEGDPTALVKLPSEGPEEQA